jgi:hypothetical protein
MIALYYLLRVGEYTVKGSRNNTKQTVNTKTSLSSKRTTEESSDAFRGMHLHTSSHRPTGPH